MGAIAGLQALQFCLKDQKGSESELGISLRIFIFLPWIVPFIINAVLLVLLKFMLYPMEAFEEYIDIEHLRMGYLNLEFNFKPFTFIAIKDFALPTQTKVSFWTCAFKKLIEL